MLKMMTAMLLLAAALSGCDRLSPQASESNASYPNQNSYSAPQRMTIPREEFRARTEGKTTDEVLAQFGRPDRTNEYSSPVRTTWIYKEITHDNVSGQVDDYVYLRVIDGIINDTSF